MRILAVDPGDKRIGLAISDPSGTIANPLKVLVHVSRLVDAAQIVDLAQENDVSQIVVGVSLDADGIPTPQGRKSLRMKEAIESQCSIPVTLWDEEGTTAAAQEARFQMGVVRQKRQGHMDDLAATVLLQRYLDGQAKQENEETS
ncbi:MAG TPA: Holliday junction resolvase RuvX [Anaerolineaceae bacterium]|nr:Holliday junction resolvase RuvX [Anaerolineaceae bacterium]HPN50874.1 Holliday junction resolvase RuvX [Anaerolineaceae bacterium]